MNELLMTASQASTVTRPTYSPTILVSENLLDTDAEMKSEIQDVAIEKIGLQGGSSSNILGSKEKICSCDLGICQYLWFHIRK